MSVGQFRHRQFVIPRLVGLLVAAAVSFCFLTAARSQTYPTKPVRIIAPFGAGGTVGFVITLIAQKLETKWGQRVLVDPRPGGAGNIGAEAVMHSEPDGYTLLFTTQALAVNVSESPSVAVHPLMAFEPVAYVASGEMVLLVPATLPVTSLAEFVTYAKQHPGDLNFASLGNGSMSQLAAELFNSVAGIKTTEIPYTGPGPATMDLLAGRISFWMTNIPNVQAGNKTRALAVAGTERAPQLPDVPTFAEQGYGDFKASAWFALYAPAKTPKAIIDQLNHDVDEVLAMPDVQQRFFEVSLAAPGGTPEDLRQHVQNEIDRWAKVISDSQASSAGGKADRPTR